MIHRIRRNHWSSLKTIHWRHLDAGLIWRNWGVRCHGGEHPWVVDFWCHSDHWGVSHHHIRCTGLIRGLSSLLHLLLLLVLPLYLEINIHWNLILRQNRLIFIRLILRIQHLLLLNNNIKAPSTNRGQLPNNNIFRNPIHLIFFSKHSGLEKHLHSLLKRSPSQWRLTLDPIDTVSGDRH